MASRRPESPPRQDAETAPAQFRIGVFVLIWRDDRVLLSRRRDSGWWNLPGGGLDLEETVDACAIRETREETGLDVAVERLVGVYSKPQKHEVVLTFECRVTGGKLRETEEATEHAYFPPDALPPKTLPKHAERVADAARHLPGAIVKTQSEPSVRET